MKNELPPRSRLLALVNRFPRKRILVLGDLMLDRYIRGSVRRISPEAPVPVVQVSEESHAPGGAGNVCCNLASLDARVSVLSVLGDDTAGEQILSDLKSRGVDTSGVHLDSGRVSTQKTRVVAEHQQVVRFDRETTQALSAQAQTRLISELAAGSRSAQAVVISDYGKGIITPQVLSGAIQAARKTGIPVVVDPKIEHFKRYKGVDCITPNLQEAWLGMRLLPSTDEEAIRRLGRRILRELRVKTLIITRGEKGMTLFQNHGMNIRHIPTQAKEVYDVTGAGDTVTSVMALALASGASSVDAAVIANLAAGIVVGKLGTATTTAEELKEAVRGARR